MSDCPQYWETPLANLSQGWLALLGWGSGFFPQRLKVKLGLVYIDRCGHVSAQSVYFNVLT